MDDLFERLRACFIGKEGNDEIGEADLERFKRALKEGTSLDPDRMSEAVLMEMYKKINRKSD